MHAAQLCCGRSRRFLSPLQVSYVRRMSLSVMLGNAGAICAAESDDVATKDAASVVGSVSAGVEDGISCSDSMQAGGMPMEALRSQHHRQLEAAAVHDEAVLRSLLSPPTASDGSWRVENGSSTDRSAAASVTSVAAVDGSDAKLPVLSPSALAAEASELRARLARTEASRDELARQQGHLKGTIAKVS